MTGHIWSPAGSHAAVRDLLSQLATVTTAAQLSRTLLQHLVHGTAAVFATLQVADEYCDSYPWNTATTPWTPHTQRLRTSTNPAATITVVWPSHQAQQTHSDIAHTMVQAYELVFAHHQPDDGHCPDQLCFPTECTPDPHHPADELSAARLERLDTIEQFATVQHAIANHAELEHILDAITSAAATVMRSEHVILQLHNPEAIAASGIDFDLLESFYSHGYTSGFGERAYAQRGVVMDNNFVGTPEAVVLSPDPVYAAISVPVLQKAEPIGYLAIMSQEPGRTFDSLDAAMAASFADYAVLAVNDHLAQQKLHAALSTAVYQSTHDPLTTLANRSLFDEAVAEAICDQEHKHAVMYLDCDYFKNINDTHGHQVGDLVLQTLADRYKKAVRGEDVVARLGGDEFAILAYKAGTDGGAEHLADRILRSACRPIVVSPELTISPSISVGVAITAPELTLAQVVGAADAALYAAKAAGRRQVHYA